jgi:hypothetical protein
VRKKPPALDDVTHLASQLGLTHRPQWGPVPGDPSLGGLEHPVDHPQRRGLAAPRGAHDYREIVRRHRQVQIGHGGCTVSEGFAD